MGEQKHVSVSVNTGALHGNYLAQIQNLLDVIAFVYAGRESVTEEQYQSHLSFINVDPANTRKLSFQDARDHSSQWLLTSFLKDSVNATGSFLDECWEICAWLRSNGRSFPQEFDVIRAALKEFSKLNFPTKFRRLREQFGVETNPVRHSDCIMM